MKLFNFDIKIEPKWEKTQFLQECIWNYIMCAFGKEEYADKISMAGTELLENAIKYGDNSQIAFSLSGTLEEVVIEVKNQIANGTEEDIKALDERIQWIRGFQNPFEAYIECIKFNSKTENGVKSRLGLVRISYEANGILDFFVNENNEIAVSATIALQYR